MTQKHIIVTGMGGFLGRCAVVHFAALGFRVTGIGHGIPPAVSGDVDCRVGDVSRESLRALIAERGRPTVLLHAAGTGSVAAAVANLAKEAARTIGTLEAAIAALRELSPDATLIYPSSVAVYGDTGPQPAPESFPLRPQSEYARLKVSAEALCLERSPGPCAVLRFSSLYGPGLCKQLIWDLSKRLRDGARSLELGGTGEESRDFLHGADAARIIALAAEHRPEPRAVLNAGSGEALTVRQVAETLIGKWKSMATLRFSGVVRPGDPLHLRPSVNRIRGFGFVPGKRFDSGVADYVAWFSRVSP